MALRSYVSVADLAHRRQGSRGTNPAAAGAADKGGVITLVDDKGLKVHGLSYTKEQARNPG